MPTRSTFDRSRPRSVSVVTKGTQLFKVYDGYAPLQEMKTYTICVEKNIQTLHCFKAW
jgi:hypothetical protein